MNRRGQRREYLGLFRIAHAFWLVGFRYRVFSQGLLRELVGRELSRPFRRVHALWLVSFHFRVLQALPFGAGRLSEEYRRSGRGFDRMGSVQRAGFGLPPVVLGGSRIGWQSHRHGKRKARRAVQYWIYDNETVRRRLALAKGFDVVEG